jgi:hypothetical protein
MIRTPRPRALRIAASRPWATQITAAITRLQALAPADRQNHRATTKGEPAGPSNRAHPARQPGRGHNPALKSATSTTVSQPHQDHGRSWLAQRYHPSERTSFVGYL